MIPDRKGVVKVSDGPKILIVDDDKDLVAVLRIALESRGHRVTSAYDLLSGLQAAGDQRPDCIVLDIMMPHATEGFHFVWRLRQRETQQECKHRDREGNRGRGYRELLG